MTSTVFTIEGYRIVRNLGVVRGITVRSRSVLGNFAGGIQTLFGGNITNCHRIVRTRPPGSL
jgi:uncharacterized protein YbjQ (UPF0145 family)